MGIKAELPKPPLCRMIKEFSFWNDKCPDCGSSMSLKWFFKKKCIHPECGKAMGISHTKAEMIGNGILLVLMFGCLVWLGLKIARVVE